MKRIALFPKLVSLAISGMAVFSIAQTALAAGVVGNGTPGSCTETALNEALSGGGEVTFNCGANPHTILLTGEKIIFSSTSLDGGNLITLDGGGTTRLFSVNALGALELKNITLRRGLGTPGGAINNGGSLTISNSSLTSNVTYSNGGAINNSGMVTITNSSLTNNNAAAAFAGGISNESSGVLTMIDSIVANNSGGLAGGGIINYGTATLQRVTFDNNTGAFGGGLVNFGSLLVEQSVFTTNRSTLGHGGAIQNEASGKEVIIRESTFTDNQAQTSGGAIANFSPLVLEKNLFHSNSAITLGGAIYNYSNGTLTATNNTLAENTATDGGGIYSIGIATLTNNTLSANEAYGLVNAGAGVVESLNTLLADNSPSNCLGTITSLGYNLEDVDSCGFNITGDLKNNDPLLGPLADNGGNTLTFALLVGSPAINAGSNTDCPATDQRGMRRPLLGVCDIGAYEFGIQLYLPRVRR